MNDEVNYSSGGINLIDRNLLPIVEIYTDENGVCYLHEDDYVTLIRPDLPEVSYSYRQGEGRFFALDSYEMNTVLSRNSLNVHMAYRTNNNDILSNDMVQNENVDESTDVSSEPSGSDSGTDSSIDNPEDASLNTESTDASSEPSGSDSGTDSSIDNPEDASLNTESTDVSSEPSGSDSDTTEDTATSAEEERAQRSSDLEYITLLQERIQRIQNELNELRGRQTHDITGHVYNQIKGHELELQFLQRMVQSMNPRPEIGVVGEGTISTIDSLRDHNHERQNQYQQQIEELRALRNDVLTARVQRRLDRRIERMNRRLARMQRRDVFAGNIQRSIMYPRYLYEARKRSLLLHAEGRVLAYQDRIHDNEVVQSNLDTMYSNSLIRGVHEVVCDIRGVYYQNRLGRAQEILNEMNSTNSVIHRQGARVTSLSKRYLNQIRQRMEEREREQNLSGGVVAAV